MHQQPDPQPPLTGRIQGLEPALGVRRFEHSRRGSRLSAAGVATLPELRRLPPRSSPGAPAGVRLRPLPEAGEVVTVSAVWSTARPDPRVDAVVALARQHVRA